MTNIRKVAIVGGSRIPFVRSNTAYSDASNMDMLTAALKGLVLRFDLEGERLGELAAGAELGRFYLGSTAIVLFGHGAVELNGKLAAESPVRMGQLLGLARPSSTEQLKN